MKDKLIDWWHDDTGQGMVEYGLILALVAVAVLTMVTNIGQNMVARFTTINAALQ